MALKAAIEYASKMHNQQFRKGSNIPYITHPMGVMTSLLQHGIKDQDILMTAILHDVLEDSPGI